MPETNYYFVGIGGIGMSALAQLLVDRGESVSGSDRAQSPVTDLLQQKGIAVVFEQVAENLPLDTNVLVYSAAVAEEHPERARAKAVGIPQLSYFEMLGRVASGARTVAVAGTHGKTTTTGMLSRILIDADASPTCVVGSLVADLGSNYVQGASDLFVVEACEYQRHFLNLSPEVLVVTNLEFDHTDYFKDLADVQRAFRSLMEKVPEHGTIITDTENPNITTLLEGLSCSVVHYPSESNYLVSLPGEFNLANAKAAAAAAKAAYPAIKEDKIVHALASFKGTWRRFEYKGKTNTNADVYDDYAHHPTAIQETLRALKGKTTGKVIVAFHPHLYSRTRDLLEGFARSFTDADEVLVAPIFAAREVDDGSVSSELLAERIRAQGVSARATTSLEETQTLLQEMGKEGDSLMTMGAGDIYKVANALV